MTKHQWPIEELTVLHGEWLTGRSRTATLFHTAPTFVRLMAVDSSAINFSSAISSFAPDYSAQSAAAAAAAPILECGDGSLMATQVRSLFQILMERVGGVPASQAAPKNIPTNWSKATGISELVGAILNEGMEGAEDGDVTGRNLKFMTLCHMLATFAGVQNHAVLTSIQDCVDDALGSLLPTPGPRACIFDFLLHAFLHSIKMAKIKAMYCTGRGLEQVKCVLRV